MLSVRAGKKEMTATRPRRGAALGPGFVLDVRVVKMMMVVVMVMGGREHGAREHHQKQGYSENLFHGKNVARPWLR